jgi:hypothetical protein
MMAIAAVVRTTPRCVMTINKSDQPALNKRASQHEGTTRDEADWAIEENQGDTRR